jgi:hypothetical protein
MRAYEITAGVDDTTLAVRFAGTQADAREARNELVEQFDIKKSNVSIDEVEIPVAKAGLLEFINELSARADAAEEDDDGE